MGGLKLPRPGVLRGRLPPGGVQVPPPASPCTFIEAPDLMILQGFIHGWDYARTQLLHDGWCWTSGLAGIFCASARSRSPARLESKIGLPG